MKMGSKVFLILAILVSIFLLISSEVAAGDLAETTNDDQKNADQITEETNGVDDAKYNGGYGEYPGGDYGGYPGGGSYGGYPGGRGGYCRYGCCDRGYYGRGRRCRRCCSYASEAFQAQTDAIPHN